VHKSSIVTLGGREYEITNAKLRKWLQLEDLREELRKAADREDRTNKIYSYLSVAISDDIDYSTLPWFEVAQAYTEVLLINLPRLEFPMLKSAGNYEKVPWNYDGRSWYSWSHIIADSYGWTLDYIAELDVDDAIGLIQEINIDKQLDREWEWMLSDKSVVYDKQGKGKFKEYERPDGMVDKEVVDRTHKGTYIKKSLLPIGNVVRWSDEPADA
jgi:hypothetical protein